MEASDELVQALRTRLSSDERDRADRFRFPRHRRRFIVARASLRAILGSLLQQRPEDLTFRYGPQGKPWLESGPSFNLSHTGERVLIAVTREGRLGVDIEEVKPVRDLEALAERNFSPDETARVSSTSATNRPELFFRIWTRKEAFLKALGGGLSVPLDSFSIDPEDQHPGGLIRVDDPNESQGTWLVKGLDCAPGAHAALAIDRSEVAVLPLPFTPETK